ncbi:MAG: NMD3-related protein [Candidatus Woesearchaeota archaeon]
MHQSNNLKQGEVKDGKIQRCISCGRAAEVGFFCSECFLRENPILLAFPEIEIIKCPSCGRIFYENAWHNTQVEKAIQHLLLKRLKLNQEYKDISFEASESFPEHSSAEGVNSDGFIVLSVEATPKSAHGLRLSEEYEIPARMHYKSCNICKGRRPGYFQATIQLRHHPNETPEGKAAFEEIASTIRELSKRYSKHGLTISKEETSPNGIDFKLTLNSYAMQVAREAALRFGAPIEINERLFSQDRSGRRLYRMTALIIAPNFKVGSIVEVKSKNKRGIYRVLSTGKNLRLESVENGSILVLKKEYASNLSALSQFKAQVVRRFPSLQVLNPITFQAVTPENVKNRKLAEKALSQKNVKIVLVEERAYLI